MEAREASCNPTQATPGKRHFRQQTWDTNDRWYKWQSVPDASDPLILWPLCTRRRHSFFSSLHFHRYDSTPESDTAE